jgi:hypothetical protein
MTLLYRENPVVDRSAVANSTSQLDSTDLDCFQVRNNARRQVRVDIVHRLLGARCDIYIYNLRNSINNLREKLADKFDLPAS